MIWHYLPVYDEFHSGSEHDEQVEREYSLCEVYLDENGALSSWTASREMSPGGATLEELRSDLEKMLNDINRWQPVEFRELSPGMKFRRADG
jgi:hypothetical protein